MIEIGNPPAIRFDPETELLSIKIAKPKTADSVLDLIKEQLAHIKKANICLSGGIDSQFVLRVLNELKIPTTAYTYLITWEGSPINSDDVLIAQMLTKQYDIKLNIVEIDLLEFFKTNKHVEYAKKYRISSPQIALHLYFLETFKDIEGTVFLGGSVPLMIKNSSSNNGPGDLAALNGSFIQRNSLSYTRLANEFNIDVVKDLLFYTPAIIYKTLEINIDLVKTQLIHCEADDDNGTDGRDAHKLKQAIYQEILPGGINTLLKNTGFERLKKYLASQTGIYNEFDLRYRVTLEAEYKRTQRAHPTKSQVADSSLNTNGSVRYIVGDIPQQLTDTYRDAIAKYNSKCIYDYYFDF